MRYRPALDGLRGVCMLGVLLGHLVIFGGTGLLFNLRIIPSFAGMEYGLAVFFVMSGALITHLVLNEIERTGTVDMRQFRIRRVRRLAPALVITVTAIVCLAALGIRDDATPLGRHPWLVVASVLLLFSNWVLFTKTPLGYLTPTWSLTVEEQFYIGWPMLLRYCWQRVGASGAAVVALGLIAAGQGMSIVFASRLDYDTYATPVSGIGLLVGCLVSIGLHSNSREQLTRALRSPWLAAAAALGVAFDARWLHFHQHFALCGGYFGFDILTALLVGHLLIRGDDRSPVVRILRFGPLPFLGRISYGAYLYHATIYQMWDRSGLLPNLWARGAVDVGSAILLATASYYLVEQPIRRGRRRKQQFASVAPIPRLALAQPVAVPAILPPLPPAAIPVPRRSAAMAD